LFCTQHISRLEPGLQKPALPLSRRARTGLRGSTRERLFVALKTIFRSTLRSKYVCIPNALAQDKRLSFKARGLLLLVLSLPEDWELRTGWLLDQGLEGREAITAGLHELLRWGYAKWEKVKDSSGQFTANVWSFSDKCDYPEQPQYGKPYYGKPESGNPTTTKDTPTPSTKEPSRASPKNNKTQEAVEKYAEEVGFLKSDGTAMFWHFEAQGWGRNWKATFQKWRWNNYLPSQKAARGLRPGNIIPIVAPLRSASDAYGA
jgi:hypothetical protein